MPVMSESESLDVTFSCSRLTLDSQKLLYRPQRSIACRGDSAPLSVVVDSGPPRRMVQCANEWWGSPYHKLAADAGSLPVATSCGP